MHPIFLALAILGPPADAVPISVPTPIIRQVAASYALLPIARADPAQDAIEAYEAARAALVALRDELLRDAAEKMRQAAAITQKLGGTVPPPKPPDPPPGPVLSETAQKVRALVAQVPASARPAAARLAAIYRTQAAGIQATDTAAQIVARTAPAVQAALGSDLEAWRPAFKEIKAILDAQAAAGTLKTAEDHRRVWGELAEGFDAGTVAQR